MTYTEGNTVSAQEEIETTIGERIGARVITVRKAPPSRLRVVMGQVRAAKMMLSGEPERRGRDNNARNRVSLGIVEHRRGLLSSDMGSREYWVNATVRT